LLAAVLLVLYAPVIIGALFLHEPVTVAKVLGIVLVVVGVIVLNFDGAH